MHAFPGIVTLDTFFLRHASVSLVSTRVSYQSLSLSSLYLYFLSLSLHLCLSVLSTHFRFRILCLTSLPAVFAQ